MTTNQQPTADDVGVFVMKHPELAQQDIAGLEIAGWSVGVSDRAFFGEPIDGELEERSYTVQVSRGDEIFLYGIRERRSLEVRALGTPAEAAEHVGP